MKKKNFLCGLLLAISASCMVLGVACNDEGGETKDPVLSEDLTFSAELNESFATPYIFEDCTYSIVDENGNPVTLENGAFFCDTVGDYTIIVKKGGKTYEYPLYVRDTQKPLFKALVSESVVGIENTTVDLDDYFSATDNSGDVSIVYQVERNGIEDINVEEDGELFLQYGFYNVLAIATDPYGNTAEQFLTIQVKETKVFNPQDVSASSSVFIETSRFTNIYNEVALKNALTIDEENNGFVWQLNTSLDEYCNQFIMIDTDELFGTLAQDVDTFIFKIKLGNAFQSDESKNWVEFYNYYRDISDPNSVQLMEGDWLPNAYGDLTYTSSNAMITGMEAETEYEISLTRAVNDTTTNYLIIRVRCSMGEDGTYNYMPTLKAEQNGELTHDYTISLYDFTACATVFNNEYVAMEDVEVDKTAKTISWDRVDGAVSYQVRVGSFEICSDKQVWTDIGNVTSYDFSSLAVGTHRFAVRAVFENGFSSAKVSEVRITDPMLYVYQNAAVGRVNSTLYGNDWVEKDGSVAVVEFDGKDAIRLDMMTEDADTRHRREMLVDLEEIFGSNLQNIETISFKVYLGSAFNANVAMNSIELCNWCGLGYQRDPATGEETCATWVNVDNYGEPYVIKHLLVGEWITVNIRPSGEGSKYLDFCVSTLFGENFDRSWIEKYNAEKQAGALTSDYGVYFADFVATYKTASTINKMNEVSAQNGVVSWTAVDGATGYQIKIGDAENEWTNIGNVTSYDLSSAGMETVRYAVRAVFADGYTAASVGYAKMPTMTELFYSYAEGSLEANNYQGDYYEYDNATSLVTMASKEAIRLDFVAYSQADGRRALIIDLQEMFGDDLQNIASVSFSYYFSTGFTSGAASMTPSNWNTLAQGFTTPYVKENLFLLNGTHEDANYCYGLNNSQWYSMTLKPQASGNSRYIVLMAEDFGTGSWFNNYTADIADGTLDNDYSMYFADFVVTYK